MPASRAVWSGSPFFTAPDRTSRRASADSEIEPRAIASRLVTGFSPTSTILMRPRLSTCERRRLLFIAPGQEEGEALERHREIDALELHVGRHLERAGRKIQHRVDPGGDDEVEHVLGGGGWHGDDGDADAVAAGNFLQV